MNKKQFYEAPATEVLELHLEANVLQTGSPVFNGFGNEEELEG